MTCQIKAWFLGKVTKCETWVFLTVPCCCCELYLHFPNCQSKSISGSWPQCVVGCNPISAEPQYDVHCSVTKLCGSPRGCFQIELSPWPTPLAYIDPIMPHISDQKQLLVCEQTANAFSCEWFAGLVQRGKRVSQRRHCSTTGNNRKHCVSTHCGGPSGL